MRNIILIAAFVLVSASAQAGGSRSLTLGPSSQAAPAKTTTPVAAVATELPQTAQAEAQARIQARIQSQSTPKHAARPSPRQRHAGQVHRQNPAAARQAGALRTAHIQHRGPKMLARVVYALHRYGIYW